MNYLIALIELLYWVLAIAILVRVLLSWVRTSPTNPTLRLIVHTISRVTILITEPILAPIRRLLPGTMNLDFSPFIAIIGLDIIRRLLIGMLEKL